MLEMSKVKFEYFREKLGVLQIEISKEGVMIFSIADGTGCLSIKSWERS